MGVTSSAAGVAHGRGGASDREVAVDRGHHWTWNYWDGGIAVAERWRAAKEVRIQILCRTSKDAGYVCWLQRVSQVVLRWVESQMFARMKSGSCGEMEIAVVLYDERNLLCPFGVNREYVCQGGVA